MESVGPLDCPVLAHLGFTGWGWVCEVRGLGFGVWAPNRGLRFVGLGTKLGVAVWAFESCGLKDEPQSLRVGVWSLGPEHHGMLHRRLRLAFGLLGLECGFWGVGCGVWGVGCVVWGVGCGVRCAGCGVWGLQGFLAHKKTPTPLGPP